MRSDSWLKIKHLFEKQFKKRKIQPSLKKNSLYNDSVLSCFVDGANIGAPLPASKSMPALGRSRDPNFKRIDRVRSEKNLSAQRIWEILRKLRMDL